MKIFGFFYFVILIILLTPIIADTDEVVVNINVQVNQNSSLNNMSGNLIYESKNEINKKRVYILISATFTLLLTILILRKKF